MDIEHLKEIERYIEQEHAETFPSGLSKIACDIHQAANPIDTHWDSIPAARYFGFDLAKPDWAPQKNKIVFALAKRILPTGENKPHYKHVSYQDFHKGGFAGGCVSAHANFHNIWPSGPFIDPWKTVIESHSNFESEVRENLPNALFVKNSLEAKHAIDDDKKALIFSVEGAHSLGRVSRKTQGERLRRISSLKQLGAAYLTINHYCSTDISSGSVSVLGRPLPDNKLTAYGRDFVDQMNRVGLLIDLTHTNTNSALDICAICAENDVPAFASHASFWNIPREPETKVPGFQMYRGLHDNVLREIAETGGCVSVVMAPFFLQDRIKNGKPLMDASLDLIVDHYENLIGKFDSWGFKGEDHISFGSDFDGAIASIPLEMRNGGDLPLLTQKFVDRGWEKTQIIKLYSENFLRVWQNAEK